MKKLKCFILDDYQNIALHLGNWESLSHSVIVKSFQQHFKNEDELINAIHEADIVVIMRERTPFTEAIFNQLPNLKLLITSGMRNASIDFEAAAKYGVIVCGTESFSEPPVELTWALILGLAKHIVKENNSFRTDGPWQNTIGMDLYGKQLGLIGLGKIGSQMARIGLAFGMKVVAWSENLTKEKTDACGVQLAQSKEALLRESDYVSIHLVLSDRTRGLIGSKEFSGMKKTAFLINTSRAGIVDQDALIDALQTHKIAGAGLDVFKIEPLPEKHIFRNLPNVLAMPHLGYVTERNYRVYFQQAVEAIQGYLDKRLVRVLS